MTTICIHQPDFVPYLGFFQRLVTADHFIILDDVKFIRDGWQHRDRIKSKNGAVWLTLGVRKGSHHLPINQVELSDSPTWIEKNLNLLRECYSKAAFFSEVFPQVERIYLAGHRLMIDFNRAMLDLAMSYFDIEIHVSLASEYEIVATRTARLVELVRATMGRNYLSGIGSRDYLDVEMFQSAGLTVIWQDFRHPVYPQMHGDFAPMLSCLDLLFNCGRDAAGVLRSTLHG